MQPFDNPTLPRKVGAGRGWRWCVEAFYIVREQPLTWVLLALVYLLIHFAISLVPMIGNLIGAIVAPVFAAGFVMAASKSERGEELELADLFAGFRLMPGPLMQVGAMFFILMLTATLAVVAAGMATGVLGGLAGGHIEAGQRAAASGGVVGVLMLLMAVVVFVVSLSYWFAPAQVALGGVAPWPAVRSSLSAGLSNWLPLLVAGLTLSVLGLLALLPLGLGLLLWFPVAYVTAYTSWKDIFGQQAQPS
ncbi:hypothetical protein BI347_00180 [Chromobacterium sphagni]|uniref:DUF2189 domain-containing protein n=1 Tax=Chromobacterium sphagni TaxID=1903179 RepID=A0A1S1WXT5_9NEIS|nr:BPSS1780 family membrane protein [Chromobacterium sphagni]OHX12082.1 hypothetical protein BI347_00180 [Chromobacterium sphagni]